MQRIIHNLSNIALSLLLAILVWIAAVREQNPPREADYDHDLAVEVIPPQAGLVTTDPIPKTVRLRLLAPESSWASLTPSKFKARLDLSQLSPGFNDVPIAVAISDPQIKVVDQVPAVVSLNLQVEQTITLPVKILVMDNPPLGYINKSPSVDPAAITITGPAAAVSQVDKAVAEIFIRNSKETLTRGLDVTVRDREDGVIPGLKIRPAKVQVTLPIEQRFGYKDVSVSAVIQGQVAPGYWVSNISVDPPTLTVVGNPQVLSSIAGVIETVPLNLNQATADMVRNVPLNLPNGVTVVLPEKETGGPGGVKVTVSVAAIESGQTVRLPVMQQGIDPAYTWSASPEQAEVILSGPIPRLQALRLSDVRVIVDLFGQGPGVHKIEPTVFLPDDLRVEAILPRTIEITIARNTPPPISPVPTPTPTPTPPLINNE